MNLALALLTVLFPSHIIFCSFVPADVANFLKCNCGISAESMYKPIFTELSKYDNYSGIWYELVQMLSKNKVFQNFRAYREKILLKHSSNDNRCQELLGILLDDSAILNILRIQYFDLSPLISIRNKPGSVAILSTALYVREFQMQLQRNALGRSEILKTSETAAQIRHSLELWMFSMEILHFKPAIALLHHVVGQRVGPDLEKAVRSAHLKTIKHYEDILHYSPGVYSPDLDMIDYWKLCPQLTSLAGLRRQNLFGCLDELSFKYAAAFLVDVSKTLPAVLSLNHANKNKNLQKIGILAFVVRTIALENYLLFYFQPESNAQAMVSYSMLTLGMQVHEKLEAYCLSYS